MLAASLSVAPPILGPKAAAGKFMDHVQKRKNNFKVFASEFPAFIPKEIENIKEPLARKLASRIERLPVNLSLSKTCIMSSCVKPKTQVDTNPVVLLHGFDSSCLEWRYTLPLLEETGFETWAVDVLGWGFSDLEKLPSCSVDSKRDHLYQLWSSYIKRPMILVGPSLGAAVAIDFAVNYPEVVDKLILIDASVYAEGTGDLANLPKLMAYAGVNQKTLIIWGENDQIIDNRLAVRLHSELPNAIIRQIPDCGHIPHVEKPNAVSKLITEFVRANSKIGTPRLTVS
ncbi:alpha/beta hydrolase domain-containing protein 14a [Phtheirospermum japonicum]|uniref:Alpha/beta hydrolase domain-containing protein 14a n=1 Tax=Phtheirospermum japonicum TaxID=374723 RepID=A0A830BKC2_9LAMI|nr:alpha/beta hydrolase domain-containing protein 14a [Phtheirospermum japonicum]